MIQPDPTITDCGVQCFALLPIAIIPSIIWLSLFVFSAHHRENFGNIARVFLWGVFAAIPVLIVELLFFDIFESLQENTVGILIIGFVGVAFVEESFKYLAVRYSAVGKSFFNDAQDAVVYMVAAALGFAAIENIGFLFSAPNVGSLVQTVAFRAVSANFLHAASSAIVGYFFALSIIHRQKRRKFLYTGLILATLLHGIYNNFIINIEQNIFINGDGLAALFDLILTAIALIIAGIIVFIAFKHLAKVKI